MKTIAKELKMNFKNLEEVKNYAEGRANENVKFDLYVGGRVIGSDKELYYVAILENWALKDECQHEVEQAYTIEEVKNFLDSCKSVEPCHNGFNEEKGLWVYEG